jgi:hypothetical protein
MNILDMIFGDIQDKKDKKIADLEHQLVEVKDKWHKAGWDDAKKQEVSVDSLGFFIYCFMGQYDESGEIAHDQWTGKHYKSKLKTDSHRLAEAIHDRVYRKET